VVTSRESAALQHCGAGAAQHQHNINIQHYILESPANMAPALPDDILHVLCEELANLRQFDTLFNCACASRVLAVPALTNLYRWVSRNTSVDNLLILLVVRITKRLFEVGETMLLDNHSRRSSWLLNAGLSYGDQSSPLV